MKGRLYAFLAKESPLRDVVVMAVAQFVQYVVLTFNFRAIALGLIPAAGVTAASAALIGYVMTRMVAKAENHWGLVGMIIGGATADMVGIWLTRSWQ